MQWRASLDLKCSSNIVIIFAAADSELRFIAEMLKAFLEIIGSEAQVPVELHDKFPIAALHRVVPIVERLDHTSARFPEPAIHPMNDAYPRVLRRIAVKNGAGLIGRAIVNDHPFGRKSRFANDAFN